MKAITKKDITKSLRDLPKNEEISILGVKVFRGSHGKYFFRTQYKGVSQIFDTLKDAVNYVFEWCKC